MTPFPPTTARLRAAQIGARERSAIQHKWRFFITPYRWLRCRARGHRWDYAPLYDVRVCRGCRKVQQNPATAGVQPMSTPVKCVKCGAPTERVNVGGEYADRYAPPSSDTRDSERLDWMAAHDASFREGRTKRISVMYWKPRLGNYVRTDEFDTPREAIDAAMQATPTQKEK